MMENAQLNDASDNNNSNDNTPAAAAGIDEKKIRKRLKEERRKDAERAMLSRWLTNRLESEERNSRFNSFRVNHEYLARARAAKSAELRAELEVALPRFETSLAARRIRVAHLVDELADAELQRKTARQSHADVVDLLVEMQKGRVEILSSDYADELAASKMEFESEFQRLIDDHEREMKTADEIRFIFDARFDQSRREMEAAFESKKFDVVGETMEEKFALRSNLEAKIESLWKEFQDVVQRHEGESKDTRKAMEKLTRKDADGCADIEQRKRRILRLEAEVERLKAESNKMSADCEKINGRIEAEKKTLVVKLKEEKATLEKVRKSRAKVTRKMVVESTAAIEDLKRQKKGGEAILLLAEFCRKLETEEEKVLPWPPTSLSTEELEAIDDAIDEAARGSAGDANGGDGADDDKDAEGMVSELADHFLREMNPFWRRVAKVDLEVAALAADKAEAEAENEALKAMVNDYLKGIAVGAETVAEKKLVGGKIGMRKKMR